VETVTLRQQRGVQLAKSRIIRRKHNLWFVPSQTGDGTRYTVDLNAQTCSCPDFGLHGVKCKHIFAAAEIERREKSTDGRNSRDPTVMERRPTYRQNWPAYNAAQVAEKDKFQLLLHDLCSGIPKATPQRGRPPIPRPDAIFCIAFKVYSTMSGRRFSSDLREAHRRGWISAAPCYNTVFSLMEDESLFPVLRSLIQQSARPLIAVEESFAVDSSGFSTSRFMRWFDHKYGKEMKQHDWVKAHVMCGVNTHIVTAVEIGEPNAADTKQLAPMLDTTKKSFKISEVLGDKAYSSKRNHEIIGAAGATPFIAFQDNMRAPKADGSMWTKMAGYFQYHRDDFLEHYHQRSNIETTFSMIKRKFDEGLRSRTDPAMRNEVLCKILCHNIVVVIHEIEELGIDPKFWRAQKRAA
jgi:transposase